MTQHLRSRLRAVVATAICALVAAPALVAGTTTIAAAAPPGVTTGVLTVGGEANDGGDSNLWRLYGDAYIGLRAALVDSNNFGPSGVVKKGTFQIAPTGMTTVNSTDLANLDVFFGGIPRGGWNEPSESNALQAFVLNGGGLVLALNQEGFGDLPDWLDNTLGLSLNPTRGFYGPSACYPLPSDAGPTSAPSGSHPVSTGAEAFGPSGNLTTYHTVSALTATGSATARYTINVSGSVPQFGIDGPVGDTNAPFTIQTASINPANITSVQFAIDGVDFGLADTTFPFEAPGANPGIGPHTLTATATTNIGPSPIVSTVNINVVASAVTEVFRGCPGSGTETVNNNVSGTTVATIEPGALGAGSGPIVVTSDLDFFSSIFSGPTIGPNRTFALNTFAWLMDSILPDVPDDTYFPLNNPARIYDSRQFTPLTHLESRAIQVSGRGGVPVDAKTVVANVTVVDPDSSGYFTVYPTDAARPDTSTHNFRAGENFANMITMRLSNLGQISVFDYLDSGGNVDVIVDIVGYTRRDNSGTRLHTMAPVRVLDTRNGIGLPRAPFGAGQTQNLTVRGGATSVPTDADSVVLNMTVVNATNNASYVTVWPAGLPQPDVSNLNNVVGVARPNLVVARVNASGQISIANAFGTADIIADVVGYFRAGAYKSGGVITGLTPARILDTRPNSAFTSGTVRSLTVAGAGGIPGTAKTAILKVTAVDPDSAGGFITVWPAGTSTPPNVSNLNFGPGMTIPNLVVTQIGTAGQINIYNALGSTQVLVDVLGYAD